MGGFETPQDLEHHVTRILGLHRALMCDDVGERFPAKQLEDEVSRSVGYPDVEDVDDARMADFGGDAGLRGKSDPCGSGPLAGDDLQGDLTTRNLVLALPHFRFLPYAERPGEQVALVDEVADPVHRDFRKDNGGGGFPLSLRGVSNQACSDLMCTAASARPARG